jgi:hypothetical protein
VKIYKFIKKIFFSKAEKWLMLAIILFLVISVIYQIVAASRKDDLDLYLRESALAGAPLAEEQYLYNQGIISLEPTDMGKGECIKIYVNGVQKGFTIGSRVNLTVKTGDVIEALGDTVNEPRRLTITSVSGDVSQEYVGTYIMADSKVRILAKII